MASRFAAHSRDKAAVAVAAQEAAAAEAAARRAARRYEPLAVQEAAAAAEVAERQALPAGAVDADVATRLATGWLGARFLTAQASLFAAFIVTDNLLASLAAGLAMQLVSTAGAERYLKQRQAS
jgi:hypothetical protein